MKISFCIKPGDRFSIFDDSGKCVGTFKTFEHNFGVGYPGLQMRARLRAQVIFEINGVRTLPAVVDLDMEIMEPLVAEDGSPVAVQTQIEG